MSDDWKFKSADELDPLAVDLFREIRQEYHADLEADDEREYLRIRGHDVEEFVEIMARHGAWTDGLKYAQGALQQRLPGMEGPDEDEGDGAGTSVTIEAFGRKVELGTHPEAMEKLKRAAERAAVGAGG